MQKEPRSSWIFIIHAIHRYRTTLNVRSVCKKTVLPECLSFLPFRDTTLMYDPYAKRNPFFLNVHHSCHFFHRFCPDLWSQCKKNPDLPEVNHSCHSEILPWMYDLYAKKLFFLNVHNSCHSQILPWMYVRSVCKKLFFLNVHHSCHSEILPWCMIPTYADRVSDPDPYPDPDPHGSALIWAVGSGSGSAYKLWIRIRIQEGKNDPKK
jgi:hypothetical protein